MSIANEADNLSLCGMLALLCWVVESISVFRPSITVLRLRRKGPSHPPFDIFLWGTLVCILYLKRFSSSFFQKATRFYLCFVCQYVIKFYAGLFELGDTCRRKCLNGEVEDEGWRLIAPRSRDPAETDFRWSNAYFSWRVVVVKMSLCQEQEVQMFIIT